MISSYHSRIKKIFCFTQLLLVVSIGYAQNEVEFIQQARKNVASDREAGDEFGYSNGISGNHAVFGAHYEQHDTSGGSAKSHSGSAYVFERAGSGSWTEVQKLVASDRSVNDEFGHSVAISNNFIIVGAWFDAQDTSGGNSLGMAGSAYIFERDSAGNWNQVQKIAASTRGGGDVFGCAVSISGNYALIGAQGEDEDTSEMNTLVEAGSAYIFERDSNGTWNEVQKIVASDRAPFDYFGYTVAIDGNYLVVGALEEDEDTSGGNTQLCAGSAYVFERNGNGVWNEVQKIVASDRDSADYFSQSLSISGDYIIVGAWMESEDALGGNSLYEAGSAYIFERDSAGNWNEVQKLVSSDRDFYDTFGYSVSISGNYAFVGAQGEDELGADSLDTAGSAYAFKRDSNGIWKEVRKIVPFDREVGDRFGFRVASSSTHAIFGAYSEDDDASGGNTLTDAGSGYIFRYRPFPNQINGTIYRDININCMIDSNDTGLNNALVRAMPYGYYGSTNSAGDFTIYIDSGTYKVEQVIPDFKRLITKQNCPSTPAYHTVVLDSIHQDTSGLKFSNSVVVCAYLSIDIASNRRRRCEKSITTIQYCNQGYGDTTGVKVHVKFPYYVSVISADKAFTVDSLGDYIFDIDTLKAGDCNTIKIVDSVKCLNNIGGLTVCTEAWITPVNSVIHSLDTANTGWDTSNVDISVSCVNDTIVQVVIVNTGGFGVGDMSGKSNYRIYANGQLIHSDSFKLVGTDSMILQLKSAGETIRVEADQRPGHPGKSTPVAVVEPCDTIGSSPVGFVNQQYANDLDLAREIEWLPILNSYDPNDKRVSPEGLTAKNYIKPGTLLDYVVRFQNTGNDTAYKVVVVDTLPEQLDISTIQFGLASHAYKLSVGGKGRVILNFFFNKINLIDSFTDPLNSQGYLKFKIAPFDTLSINTEIHNTAAIYFDYNPPIITNDAWVTIHDTTILGSQVNVIQCDTTIPPVISFNTQDTTICLGSQFQLNVSGGDGYYWYEGDSINDRKLANPIVYPVQSETYWVEVRSETSCFTAKDSVRVNVTTVDTTVTVTGETLSSNAIGAAYQWLNCDSNFSLLNGETNQGFTATFNGSYAVIVTELGCTDTSACYAITGLGFADYSQEFQISVYPNPNSGQVTLSFGSTYKHISVDLFDWSGKLISSTSGENSNIIILDIPGNPGVFLLSVVMDEFETRLHVIKQ